MSAYYNENDPKTAAWLRELIKAGLIADGEVDTRSIVDVQPSDLAGFVQCHFFAGIGGWSYALRLAGWPDGRRVWTGSCPCQPFSDAGKGDGADDPRHLWPTWFRLISECVPVVVFGEQVASADGLGWFDRVSTDMEAADYAIGAVDYCAAGVGAFHLRQRLWFVADTGHAYRRSDGRSGFDLEGRDRIQPDRAKEASEFRDNGEVGELADTERRSSERWGYDVAVSARRVEGEARQRERFRDDARDGGESRIVGHAERRRCEGRHQDGPRANESRAARGVVGAWDRYDLIPCGDGTLRPVEPGTFPLAHGIPARVGRLRGYGNAIVPQVAAAFIEAYCEARGEALTVNAGATPVFHGVTESA